MASGLWRTARAGGCRTHRPSTRSRRWRRHPPLPSISERLGRTAVIRSTTDFHGLFHHERALPGRRRRTAVRLLGQGHRPVRRSCDRTTSRLPPSTTASSVRCCSSGIRRIRRSGASQRQDRSTSTRPSHRHRGIQLQELRRGRRTARAAPHADRSRARPAEQFSTRTIRRSPSCRRTPSSIGSSRRSRSGAAASCAAARPRSSDSSTDRSRWKVTTYGWNEYVLFDPYQGFRYLSEYQGHWSDIRSIHALPAVSSQRRGRRPATTTGRSATSSPRLAVTEFVLGEFPWRVEVEDRVEVADFVAPPFMLSREGTESEATWSLGEYITGEQVWKAFALPGEPPDPVGVFAHQPSPYAGKTAGYLRTFVVLALALLLAAGRSRADRGARTGVRARLRVPASRDRRGRVRHRAVYATRRRARSSSRSIPASTTRGRTSISRSSTRKPGRR